MTTTQYNSRSLALLVIYRSEKPDNNNKTVEWEMVNPIDVPAWIRDDPDIVSLMVDGNVVYNETKGGYCYRAEPLTKKRRSIIH